MMLKSRMRIWIIVVMDQKILSIIKVRMILSPEVGDEAEWTFVQSALAPARRLLRAHLPTFLTTAPIIIL